LAKFQKAMVDVSVDWEQYDGFWNQEGEFTEDPPKSDLNQYRMNLGYVHRLASRWQAGVLVPYVWNNNAYSGASSRSDGLGDSTLNLWYEAVDEKSVWRLQSWRDLIPSVTVGPSLLVPTGKSPHDDVSSSFDVTGRGAYRIDANALLEKTLHPWLVSVFLSYGVHLERSVNHEYGKDVEPYHKQLGDRALGSVSLGYKYYLGTGGDSLTGLVSLSSLREADAEIDGARDPNSGFRKDAIAGGLTYASTDHDWSVRAMWSHAIREDDWGKNFPATDIFTLGVRYAFR
jgi:hypothetical protein